LDNEDIQQLLKTGIEAAQSGNKIIARHILEQVVSQDPENEMGWLWLASVVDTVEERRENLQRVLFINPNNERAQQALSKLLHSATPAADRGPGPVPPAARLGRAPAISRPSPPPPSARTPVPPSARTPVPPIRGPQRQRRRRMRPSMYALLVVLAVNMIVAGLLLLRANIQNERKKTPTPTQSAVVVAPTRPVVRTPGPSPTPRPLETLGPTWVPSNTPTPTDTPVPTNTPLPLTSYTLVVSAKREGQTTWALYTMLANGADERKVLLSLAAIADEGADLTLLDTYDAAYSPDGTWIAFAARLREENAEYEDIFITPADGGDMRRVTTLAADHVEGVTWSPDSQQIAFASDLDGDYDIYVTSVEGDDPRPLTSNAAEDRYPAWSPDGKWIAFASDRTGPGTLEVWRMAPNGSNLKQLTDDQNSSFAPGWSPDGQSIVFVSDRRVNIDLYIMTANGDGERALLVRDVAANELDPAWSPDGRWIAFSSNRDGPIYDLYLIRPDGSELQRVTRREDDTRYVDWKP
jgi:Tol biopolymer transport system component